MPYTALVCPVCYCTFYGYSETREICSKECRASIKGQIHRLMKNSRRNEKTGCIERAAKNSRGYNSFNFRGRSDVAHRASYILHKGEIPDGLEVMHSCDNRICINPDHLSLGTRQDNMDDMAEKGRRKSVQGEKHSFAKLTEQDVLNIRASYKPYVVTASQIAAKYGLMPATVYDIIARRIWSHLP